jgi:DNA-binding CsgD family transcriptional regulator
MPVRRSSARFRRARSAVGLDWPGRGEGLSDRESEILALITQGKSNAEVAAQTYLSPNTVKSYIRTIYRKIEVGSRTQAVLWDVTMESPQTITVGFPPNRGGFLYAASGWMAAIFSYSTGGSKPAELCRRRRL